MLANTKTIAFCNFNMLMFSNLQMQCVKKFWGEQYLEMKWNKIQFEMQIKLAFAFRFDKQCVSEV